MSSDLTKAIRLLETGTYTCVLCKGDSILLSTERGVRPLVEWLEAGKDVNGFVAADKVVGKAAAFLYILLGVKEVFAPVMSESAIYTLARYGIQPICNATTKRIINRAGMDLCPMEQAVLEIFDPKEALSAIRIRMSELPTLTFSHQSGCAV